jgi:hypothetical protein
MASRAIVAADHAEIMMETENPIAIEAEPKVPYIR